MGKIIAIIFLAVFAWYAVPLLARGIWIAPTAYPDYWWGPDIYQYDAQVAQDGSGWFNFDPRESSGEGMTTATVFNSL